MAFRRSLTVLVAISCSFSAVLGQVQKPNINLPPSAASHKADVVKIFETSYQNYKKFAWGHDDLSPVSKSFSDPLGGWGASIADSLGTLQLMGMTELFNEAVNFTSTINFNSTDTNEFISVFETTIRFVGGYLSAYELSGKKYPILVEKAKEVADKLFFGFTGSSAIPFNSIDFSTNTPDLGTSNVAQAGTLTLEYAKLSQYTGNTTYQELAEKSVRAMIALADPLPGLPAQGIDPQTGEFVGTYVSWGGGTDSYLEYLIKYPRLTNTDDDIFANTWALAVDSSIRTLKKTSTVGNWTYIADFDGEDIVHVASHLECFHGGNWILGGKLLNNQTIVDVGLELVDSCWNTYASTATRIGPEVFNFMSSDGVQPGDSIPSTEQLAFYNQHGFFITASDYVQRPEVLESNFYAWRATGDTKYFDRAVSAVQSFNEFLATGFGFAGLNDVNNKNSTLIDDQPSFWFAEVLKYLFLTFDDPNNVSLDNYVFNTECHPLEAPPAKSSYGSLQTAPSHGPFKAISGPLPAVSPYPTIPIPALPSSEALRSL